ncbi:MAG: exosortase/archaeosortase family protein [Smithellaceae bacterium]
MGKNSLIEKIKDLTNTRNILFLLFAAIALITAYAPIKALYSSDKSEYYSHIALIPLVSIYLVCIKRKEIFANVNYSFAAGIPVLLTGIALFLGGTLWGVTLDKNNYASLISFSIFIFINGAFILLYGMQAYRRALFPLLFLIFTVPVPTALMDNIIYFLQVGSTEFTNLLFLVSGVPFMRDGFVFHLPNVSVEVAKQCSGIRSSMAIFIVAILAGYMFLKSYWKIFILVICAVLIAMFKNGIRIITLSLLGNYVDPQILTSSLHREGGTPFFILALLLLAPILFLLRRSEKFTDTVS